MKNRTKRKPMSQTKKQVHRAPVINPAFNLLVNSINESKDEDILVRMLLKSQII